MQIRPATLDDCAELARVQVDSYRTAYAGIFPDDYLTQFSYEEQEGDWQELLKAGSDDVLLVAAGDTGDVLGYALGRARTDPDMRAYDSELVALHVRREQHRQGSATNW
jgi:hypothetical protein